MTPPTTEDIKTESPVIQQEATDTAVNTAPANVPATDNTVPTDGQDAPRSYTTAEVATHKNGLSCWMILDNKVYDVTTYISKHPNDAILKGCGKDATQMFARHPESAKEMKEQFYIGELKS